MPSFLKLQLAPNLIRTLEEEGYKTPTPIQAQAIPPALEGRDVLGCAQTGTGKTAAFALPIIHRLEQMPADKSRRGPAVPRALILSPTRELASQIGASFATYGRNSALSHTVVFGGVSQFHQVRALHRGVDILVATPGRLMDLMNQKLVILSGVSIFVLDEADRMLDMGFIQPIRRIAAALPPPPAPRQTLLFSATMPKEIMHLAESLLKDPVRVAVTPVSSAVPLIEQTVYPVQRMLKQELLERLIRELHCKRSVVFVRTKHGADKVCHRLTHAGIAAMAIHGNKAQNFRTRAIESFRSGQTQVLVATDVAARGLDIDAISHVFNFDMPVEAESYVHRIGRTGRAGATGMAVSFCSDDERGLLRDVERLTGKRIPVVNYQITLAPGARPQAHADDDRPERDSSRRGGEQRQRRAPAQGAPSHAPAAHSHAPAAHGHRTPHTPKPVQPHTPRPNDDAEFAPAPRQQAPAARPQRDSGERQPPRPAQGQGGKPMYKTGGAQPGGGGGGAGGGAMYSRPPRKSVPPNAPKTSYPPRPADSSGSNQRGGAGSRGHLENRHADPGQAGSPKPNRYQGHASSGSSGAPADSRRSGGGGQGQSRDWAQGGKSRSRRK